jgi:hypothetical protein
MSIVGKLLWCLFTFVMSVFGWIGIILLGVLAFLLNVLEWILAVAQWVLSKLNPFSESKPFPDLGGPLGRLWDWVTQRMGLLWNWLKTCWSHW